MSSDPCRLVVIETHSDFKIGWVHSEDGEGLVLGPDDVDEPDTRAAIAAVRGTESWVRDGEFRWETVAGAKAALRLAKMAIKNRERPLPEWAKTALAAGWKAPRGWKP